MGPDDGIFVGCVRYFPQWGRKANLRKNVCDQFYILRRYTTLRRLSQTHGDIYTQKPIH